MVFFSVIVVGFLVGVGNGEEVFEFFWENWILKLKMMIEVK